MGEGGLQTALLHWLHDGYAYIYGRGLGAAADNWRHHGGNLGLSLNSSDLVINAIARSSPLSFVPGFPLHARGSGADRTVVYGSRVRYVSIVVNTTMSPFMGYQEGLPILAHWDAMFEGAKARMSGALKAGLLITPDKNDLGGGIHHWFKVQEVLPSPHPATRGC